MDEAKRYCDMAIEKNGKGDHLERLVLFQQAVIEKNQGRHDDAIAHLSDIYGYFSTNGYWDSAVECVLEWGGALRQKTKFSEALLVYEQINIANIEKYPFLRMQLHRKKGTIYKNIMQSNLRIYQSNTNTSLMHEIQENYNHAQDEYELAKKIGANVADTVERMYILSEQAEATIKISAINPTQMMRANLLLAELEKLVSLFPLPDIQIVHLRLNAKYWERNGDVLKAMQILEQARIHASQHSNQFRLFEVDYQLGRLIERNKEQLDTSCLQAGAKALERAISTQLDRDNQYILICQQSLERLRAFMAEMVSG
jgi:tetratricopeptide (TPR) repeat protein